MRTTANGGSLAAHWLFFQEEKRSQSCFFSPIYGILESDLRNASKNKIESNHKGSLQRLRMSTLNPSYLFRSNVGIVTS